MEVGEVAAARQAAAGGGGRAGGGMCMDWRIARTCSVSSCALSCSTSSDVTLPPLLCAILSEATLGGWAAAQRHWRCWGPRLLSRWVALTRAVAPRGLPATARAVNEGRRASSLWQPCMSGPGQAGV